MLFGMQGGRILRVPGNAKFAAVRSNEGILSHKPLCREAEVKLPQDVPECFRPELGALLDEGGSGGTSSGRK